MANIQKATSGSSSDEVPAPYINNRANPPKKAPRKTNKSGNTTPSLYSKSAGQTPQKKSSGHSSTLQFRGLSRKEVTEKSELDTRILTDVASVINHAQPRDPKLAERASQIFEAVAARVEKCLDEANRLSTAGNIQQSDCTDADGNLSPASAALAALPWTQPATYKQKKPFESERQIYAHMSAFILLVAHYAKQEIPAAQRDTDECRLILPFEKTDINPSDADDDTRADLILRTRRAGHKVKLQPNPSYAGTFCVAEIKSNSSTKSLNDARIQLFDYSRNIYANQHDRRFVWGLTCCGESVSAYIISNYRAYSSPAIDITDATKRREFIRLLVGWSLCRKGQLGLDETIVPCPDIQCQAIHVPSGSDPEVPVLYYWTDVIMVADKLFGRHCRCFLATPNRPEVPVSVENPVVPSVVIKDSWTICGTSEEDDENSGLEADLAPETLVNSGEVCSEINILDKINGVLGSNTEYNGLYPTLLNGGWVRQPSHTGKVLDCAREILFGLDDEQKRRTPFYFHVRYAMEPIGEPLNTARSASELIVVLCDAMRCHKAISDECSILHRDISDNNILVVRNDSGVHGLLIDFDCALDRSAGKPHGRPERTGTLPFMSIGNLTNSDIPRTMLDDWESLLYLVCWYGTFGISNNCEDWNCRHHISQWCIGYEEEIADQKRSDLSTIGGFYNRTVSGFGKHDSNIGDGERLNTLAVHLHKYMFFNPRFGAALSIPCHGTQIHRKEKDEYDNGIGLVNDPENTKEPSKPIDPFEMRVKEEQTISQDLLTVLQHHAKQARKELQVAK
ncbi:hypothetical protein LPJ74_000737 [Coemansia sp. RSA 1843]|nr:hypothetical protein LPJ74_000737 [Coemansia sp. RSA 1843]